MEEKQEQLYLGDRLDKLDEEGMQFVADCFIQQNRNYKVNPIDNSIEDDFDGYNDMMKVRGFNGYGGIDIVGDTIKLGNNSKVINHFGEIVVSKLGSEWSYYYNGENLTIWNTQHLVLSEDKESLIEIENGNTWSL
jgi:hypothetical protein